MHQVVEQRGVGCAGGIGRVSQLGCRLGKRGARVGNARRQRRRNRRIGRHREGRALWEGQGAARLEVRAGGVERNV
eukprot:147567-Chlamydomonas_euryale.AAC.1